MSRSHGIVAWNVTPSLLGRISSLARSSGHRKAIKSVFWIASVTVRRAVVGSGPKGSARLPRNEAFFARVNQALRAVLQLLEAYARVSVGARSGESAATC